MGRKKTVSLPWNPDFWLQKYKLHNAQNSKVLTIVLYLNLLWTQDTGHPSVWGLLFMMISFLLTQFNIRFTSSNGWKNRSSIHLTAEFLGFFWVFKSLSENFSLTFCLNKNIIVVWGLVNLFLSPTESLSYPLSWVCLSLQGALS